jgi:dipeptidase D
MAFNPENLAPEALWKHFAAVCKTPHCSGDEKALGDYATAFARENGCRARRDTVGNVMVEVPASPGRENAPIVVLQGHLDMVCEKNSDTPHDFVKDPIDAYVDGDWMKARGTTLGADNGMGVAAALALIEDRNCIHGPLELLFTVDEETGLNGAGGLAPGSLKGRILLNLDSEEEGVFFIGCAGGADSEIVLPIGRKSSAKGEALKITLSGLRGGHSGLDIDTGRGNALQLLARMLFNSKIPFDLVHLEGGNKHNAIPREAFAHVLVAKARVDGFKQAVQKRFGEIQHEYKTVEKEAALKFEAAAGRRKMPMDEASRSTFLSLLLGLPHGVMAMSQEIHGLVETSNNVAIVRCLDKKVKIHTSSRSSIASALEATRSKIEAVAKLSGAKIKHLKGYPGWNPDLSSPLLKTMKQVYQTLTGKEPEVKAVHAGLECGIIGEKFPGMDMISFGPDLSNPHSPDEKVRIPSVARFYGLVTATLNALANSGSSRDPETVFRQT